MDHVNTVHRQHEASVDAFKTDHVKLAGMYFSVQ